MGAISSNGTANMSCSTKTNRSAGASVSSTTSNAVPTESAKSASRSCSGFSTGSGTSGPIGCSRRDLRERNMSRQTRATTVVSHPLRLAMPAVSERLSRS
jgi:hypothetical protein